MGMLNAQQVGSLVQKHEVHIANDLLWATGEMEALGNPHFYINQEGLEFLALHEAQIAPWSFSGLPMSRTPLMSAARERIHLLIFTQEASLADFRLPPQREKLVLHLPLAIIRGEVPFLGETKVSNFLEFWKGIFFPVIDAEIYYLAECAIPIPSENHVIYVNRTVLQSYISA